MMNGKNFVDITIKRVLSKHTPDDSSFLNHVNDNLSDEKQDAKQLEMLQNAMTECISSDIKTLFGDIKYLRDEQAMAMLDLITEHQRETIKHFRAKINVDKVLTGKE